MKFLFSIFVLLSFCCNQPHSTVEDISFKDSVVRRYLSLTDSIRPYDTNNYQHKILKAYMENDTAFFKKLNRDINIDTTFLRSWAEWDSCVNIPKLSDMAVDEAYRFTHSQSFCDFGQKITISRSGNIVNLQYIEFSNGDGHASTLEKPDGSIINIPPYCVIAKQFDKILSMKEWDELVRRVYAADYWMLASKGHINSTDGSFWQIEAYSNQRIHLVKRQCGCYSVFENIGRYFLQISGEKTMCSEFF